MKDDPVGGSLVREFVSWERGTEDRERRTARFMYRESPRMGTAPLFLTADRGKREAVVIGIVIIIVILL